MNAITPNPREAVGGNRPPVVDFYREANVLLPAYLADDNVELVKRAKALLESFLRAPAEVTDDETAGKMSLFEKQLFDSAIEAEDKREADKKPTREAGTIIDDFFKAVRLPLLDAKAQINARLTKYLQKKVAAEQAARAAAERATREKAEADRKEAERLAAEAMTEQDIDKAIAAEETAEAAEVAVQQAVAAVEVRPVDLSRTYSSFGTVASLKTKWVGSVVNRETLDLNALRPYFTAAELEKALRGAVAAGIRKVEGAHIREESKAGVR